MSVIVKVLVGNSDAECCLCGKTNRDSLFEWEHEGKEIRICTVCVNVLCDEKLCLIQCFYYPFKGEG